MSSKSVTHRAPSLVTGAQIFFSAAVGVFISGARGCTFQLMGHFSGILHHNCGMTGESLGSTSRMELHINGLFARALTTDSVNTELAGWYCRGLYPLWLFRRIVMAKPVQLGRVLISCRDYEMVLGVIALWGARDGGRDSAFMASLCMWSPHTPPIFALVDEFIFFKQALSHTFTQTHRALEH